ncbi:hypothetical protein ACQEVF_48485 [Nonomuraea polychroma]|uniref:hypothetical protein n=1 Tax=Nonomuraea polychroma TaxID=46176 RepID=UPI003D9092A9
MIASNLQQTHERPGMRLRFLGKDSASAGGDSPTLYATDRDSFVIQGWIIPTPEALPTDQTRVEIPFNLFEHFAKDGLHKVAPRHGGPIVHVSDHETCIVQGTIVTDPDALSQMRIPSHESCVEVSRGAIAALQEGNNAAHA